MSIYKSSSLAMIPTAYKDGKLYSVRPTDGDGDFTFSRGSNLAATRVASSGYIEKGRENLLLQSNAFNTTWATTNASVTGGQSGYDGTSDAWLLNESAAGGRVFQTISGSGVMTMSLYAKSGTLDFILVYINTTGTDPYAYFDLTNGDVSTSGVGSRITASAEGVGGGWYRLSVTGNVGTLSAIELYPANSLSSHSTSAGSIYIQDAQLEQGLVATNYIETGATTAKAGILEDMPRLDYSGSATCPSLLLEPQRTNLFTYSEYIEGWSTSNTGITLEENAVTSPEGVVNAAKIKEDANNAAHAVRQLTGPTLTSGTDYTFSFFAKKGERSIVAISNTIGASNDKNCFFDLENGEVLTNQFDSASIEDFGNGWFRCIATDTADANDDYDTRIYTATADNQFSHQGVLGSGLYIFGLQLEAGNYPTSYIPTYGSSVTRSSDALETSPYDYQSQGVLGANVGTIILDCETIGTSTGSNDFHMFGEVKSIADGYLFRANTGTTIDILERDSNSTSAQWTGIAVKQTRNKIGVSYNGADVDVYVNGVAKSLSSGTPQGGGNINGFNNSTSNKAGLIIHQILLFPNKLTDSEMASITTL